MREFQYFPKQPLQQWSKVLQQVALQTSILGANSSKGLNMGEKLNPLSLCLGVHSLWLRDPTVISFWSPWVLEMPSNAHRFIYFCCSMTLPMYYEKNYYS